jgi:hypothetical protein
MLHKSGLVTLFYAGATPPGACGPRALRPAIAFYSKNTLASKIQSPTSEPFLHFRAPVVTKLLICELHIGKEDHAQQKPAISRVIPYMLFPAIRGFAEGGFNKTRNSRNPPKLRAIPPAVMKNFRRISGSIHHVPTCQVSLISWNDHSTVGPFCPPSATPRKRPLPTIAFPEEAGLACKLPGLTGSHGTTVSNSDHCLAPDHNNEPGAGDGQWDGDKLGAVRVDPV